MKPDTSLEHAVEAAGHVQTERFPVRAGHEAGVRTRFQGPAPTGLRRGRIDARIARSYNFV